MHFLVLGATGRNGTLIVAEALSRGHTVTALVRNPSSPSSPLQSHPSLTLVKGSPLSQPDIEAALAQPRPPQAVITALAQTRTSDSPFSPLAADSSPEFITQAIRALLAAVQGSPLTRNAPPKIVVNGAQGTAESWASLSWVFRSLLAHSNMKTVFSDHTTANGELRASGLKFVVARAARLSAGDAAQEVKVFPDNGRGVSWNPTVSRQSLSRWMVEAAETPDWDGRTPVLTN